MKYGNEIKNICHLAWPAIIQEAMNTVVTYVDTAVLWEQQLLQQLV